MILDDIINQLESCGYTCKAGRLESSLAWIELKRFARDLERQTGIYVRGLPELRLNTGLPTADIDMLTSDDFLSPVIENQVKSGRAREI